MQFGVQVSTEPPKFVFSNFLFVSHPPKPFPELNWLSHEAPTSATPHTTPVEHVADAK